MCVSVCVCVCVLNYLNDQDKLIYIYMYNKGIFQISDSRAQRTTSLLSCEGRWQN